MSWSSRRGASAATGRRSPLRAWRPMPGPVLQSPEAIAAALRAMSAELAADGDHPERRDMGTTVVGLSLSPERVIWFNVGDVAAEADDSLGP